MYLSSVVFCLIAVILIIGTSALPSRNLLQADDSLDPTEIQDIFRRSNDLSAWSFKRNSALCDYRLQFRPSPLTSTLCGYGLLSIQIIKYLLYLFFFLGNTNKVENTVQVHPFKYG